MSTEDSSLALSLIGICSVLGRVSIGVIADKTGTKNCLVASMVILGGCVGLWPHMKSKGEIMVLSGCYGFFAGAFPSLPPSIAAEVRGGGREERSDDRILLQYIEWEELGRAQQLTTFCLSLRISPPSSQYYANIAGDSLFQIVGVQFFLETPGALFGPVLVGKLYDTSGSYESGAWMTSAVMVIGVGVLASINSTTAWEKVLQERGIRTRSASGNDVL